MISISFYLSSGRMKESCQDFQGLIFFRIAHTILKVYFLSKIQEEWKGNLKLGMLGEVSFRIYKLGELGEVSFGMRSWVS